MVQRPPLFFDDDPRSVTYMNSLRCTNHIFIYQIHIEKKYKTSKHTNKLHILYKHVIKIKIFKMNLNKK